MNHTLDLDSDFKGLCTSRMLMCFKQSLLSASEKLKGQQGVGGRGHSEAQTMQR